MGFDEEFQAVPVCPSARWTLAIMQLWGAAVNYIMRMNLNVAIVCMVRNPSNVVINVTGQQYTFNNTQVDLDQCGILNSRSFNSTQNEFDWSKSTRSLVLSSIFIGYFVTLIPGGWLSARFGGKHVIGSGILLTTVCTLLLPVSARWHISLVIVLRVLMGIGTGLYFPSCSSMWGLWAPPMERTRLLGVAYAGIIVGSVVSFSVAGLLCDTGFDGGWPLVFYASGAIGIAFLIFWYLLVYNSPMEHPRISSIEKHYIIKSMKFTNLKNKKKKSVPWLRILKSGPVWGNVFAQVGTTHGLYTLLTGMPIYMKEVLKFDIKENGVLSALPHLGMFVTTQVMAQIADRLTKHNVIKGVNVRRLFQSIGMVVPAAFLVGAGFVSCQQRFLAVLLLVLCGCFSAGIRCGYVVTAVDIAPRYSGIVFAFGNSFATINGILVPIITGALTPQGTREEWQRVFYLCSVYLVIGCVLYVILTSGDVQDWAKDDDDNVNDKIELSVIADKTESSKL